jgi:hypothetical protein
VDRTEGQFERPKTTFQQLGRRVMDIKGTLADRRVIRTAKGDSGARRLTGDGMSVS